MTNREMIGKEVGVIRNEEREEITENKNRRNEVEEVKKE